MSNTRRICWQVAAVSGGGSSCQSVVNQCKRCPGSLDKAGKAQALHVCPQAADVAALKLQQVLAGGLRLLRRLGACRQQGQWASSGCASLYQQHKRRVMWITEAGWWPNANRYLQALVQRPLRAKLSCTRITSYPPTLPPTWGCQWCEAQCHDVPQVPQQPARGADKGGAHGGGVDACKDLADATLIQAHTHLHTWMIKAGKQAPHRLSSISVQRMAASSQHSTVQRRCGLDFSAALR